MARDVRIVAGEIRWASLGTAVIALGFIAYGVAFFLPAWDGPCQFCEQQRRVVYSGVECFFNALVWAGPGGIIAWLANPLIWISYAVWFRRRRRPDVSASVGLVVTGGIAAALAVIGTRWFTTDYSGYSALVGCFAWIGGLIAVPAGALVAVVLYRLASGAEAPTV